MSDDSFKASELRRRYQAGGSLPDDNLSARQLRARHGIESNKKNFGGDGSDSSGLIPIILFILVALLVGGYVYKNYLS